MHLGNNIKQLIKMLVWQRLNIKPKGRKGEMLSPLGGKLIPQERWRWGGGSEGRGGERGGVAAVRLPSIPRVLNMIS